MPALLMLLFLSLLFCIHVIMEPREPCYQKGSWNVTFSRKTNSLGMRDLNLLISDANAFLVFLFAHISLSLLFEGLIALSAG